MSQEPSTIPNLITILRNPELFYDQSWICGGLAAQVADELEKLAQLPKWHTVDELAEKWHGTDPNVHLTGFAWVRRQNGGIELAYVWFEDNQHVRFQTAESVGDREGLSVEYYDDVTHWAEAVEPPFDSEAKTPAPSKQEFRKKQEPDYSDLSRVRRAIAELKKVEDSLTRQLSIEHLNAAKGWDDWHEMLAFAVENEATVQEMRNYRKACRGE